MRLPQILWDPLPYERFSARFVGGAITVMFCGGLLLGSPWPSQSASWAVLVPGGAWLVVEKGRSVVNGSGPTFCFWLTVVGMACYFGVLLLSTALAGLQDALSFAKHVRAAVLCIVAVAFIGLAHRYDRGFARYLGRWMSVAMAVSALILISAALAMGAIGHDRLEGIPALNWVLNPNAIGGVYAVCFAVALGHGLRRNISTRERAATWTMALLPLAIVLLTESRGAMLGCFAAILIMLFALPRRGALSVCGLLLAATALTAIAFPEWISSLVSRENWRIAVWLHYLDISGDRIWLGHGLDFDARFPLDGGIIFTPHNILLAALFRSGVLGMLSLTVALVGAVLAALSAARQGWWLPLTALASSLALSSVDHEAIPTAFNFYWYLFWLPLGLAAAAALAPSDPGDGSLPAVFIEPSVAARPDQIEGPSQEVRHAGRGPRSVPDIP